MSSIFNCLFCQAVFVGQQALIEHIISTNCAYYANLNAIQSSSDNDMASANESVQLTEYKTETGFVNDVDVQDANLSDVSMKAGFEGNNSASTESDSNTNFIGMLFMIN